MKIKLFFLHIFVFLLNILYSFIKLFNTKNKIVLLSRQSDTISLDFKLISEKLYKEMPDYEIIVLCKKINNKFLYIFHILKQMYHLSTSKVCVIDSYCIAVSVLKHKKNLKIIQIWHAIGSMKKFGYASLGMPEGSTYGMANVMKMHKNYDYALISSMNFSKDFIEGFHIEKEKIIEIPLPRVDLLIDKKYEYKIKKKYYKKNKQLRNKKNILYCGTFRKKEDLSGKAIKKLIDCIDFDKYNFIYQPHPLSKVKINDTRIIKNLNNTFEALFVSDFVISDYSSIIYEAGLLNKPVYLYAYDWEKYKKKRQINFDIEHDVPTIFTNNPKTIIDAIENNKFNAKEFSEFVSKNVHIPKNGCLNSIIELIKSLC